MSLKFSPDKKRVFCGGCQQFQPALTKADQGVESVICSACLHTISDKPADVDEAFAAGVIKGRYTKADGQFWDHEDAPKKPLPKEKPLPKPTTETRPARNEGTR